MPPKKGKQTGYRIEKWFVDELQVGTIAMVAKLKETGLLSLECKQLYWKCMM
jgi:hypothetical protein